MSASMPELGSKISLISKADIRYEGRLFTVDPLECTIALAKVRSYGTEERETQYPILPQNQVYDYILFRGSDIKDIRVINSVPLPNDPAIMQMHLPNTPQQFQQPQFSAMNQFPGPQLNQSFANMYPGIGVGLAGPNLPAVSSPSNTKPKQSSELNNAILESSATTQLLDQASIANNSSGSRSVTPTSSSRKSPVHDMATQANRSNNGRDNNRRTTSRNKSQPRERKDSVKNDGQQQAEQKNQQRNQQFHGNNRNWIPRGNNQMRGNRSRGRGPHQQVFNQVLQNNKVRSKSATKYESDYDFEEAYKTFQDMCSGVDNLKVNDEANPQQLNGEVDKKDDSGNETTAGDQEVEEDDATVTVAVGYDKTKSFFDNISCEGVDRAKGKNKDWRQERKINSETFGVSAKRGGFYNYRGRGYYNRNTITGGYRGNMGYNRGGNYRGRNYNNRSYNSHSTGIPPHQNNRSEQPAVNSTAPVEAAAN